MNFVCLLFSKIVLDTWRKGIGAIIRILKGPLNLSTVIFFCIFFDTFCVVKNEKQPIQSIIKSFILLATPPYMDTSLGFLSFCQFCQCHHYSNMWLVTNGEAFNNKLKLTKHVRHCHNPTNNLKQLKTTFVRVVLLSVKINHHHNTTPGLITIRAVINNLESWFPYATLS